MTPAEGKRVRKQVSQYTPPDVAEKAEHVIYQGKGKTLGSIPRVNDRISSSSFKSDDELAVFLYQLVYGRKGKQKERKRDLRKFCGIDPASDTRVTTKLNKTKVKLLKDGCAFFDLQSTGTKDELVGRLKEFIVEPKVLNTNKLGSEKKKAKKAAAKPKKKAKKVKKVKDPNAPKRYMNHFFLYVNEKREQIRRENPDIKPTQVSTKAKEMFESEPESVRNQYYRKALEDKERYEKEMKIYRDSGAEAKFLATVPQSKPKKRKAPKKKAAPKKAKVVESESEDESGSEEEDDDDDEDLNGVSIGDMRKFIKSLLASQPNSSVNSVLQNCESHFGVNLASKKEQIKTIAQNILED